MVLIYTQTILETITKIVILIPVLLTLAVLCVFACILLNDIDSGFEEVAMATSIMAIIWITYIFLI